ncbi:MAG: hypothetical protein IT261_13405 [Saprospiraceae bacterium]|nr:hypothetical protein [Saprospiraceae bacterium]
MRTIPILMLAAGALLLVNCRTHGPAFLANADPYMAKPVYRGENQGAFYLSGRYNQGYEYYEGEQNRSGEFSAHAALAMENFYACGGFFGYFGKYDVNAAVSPVSGGGHQSFNGGGIRAEIGARIPLAPKMDVLIGVNGEYFLEGGPYAENSSDALADVFTLGLTRTHLNLAPALDIRFVPSRLWDIGLRYSLDTYRSVANLYESNQPRSFLHRLTLHTTFNRFTLYGQAGFTHDEQQVYSLGAAIGLPFKKSEKTNSD